MKRMMMGWLLLPALALCACGSGGVASAGSVSTEPIASSSTSVVSKAADVVTLDSARALLVAEDAYQAVAQISTTLVDQGVIHGAAATKLRALNATATAALETGFAAQTATGKAAAAAKAIDAISGIHALIGK
jgi:hypothetical protein